MEEKKVKKIAKAASNETPREEKKLSYEELVNVCNQITEQNRQLVMRLQEANVSNTFKRLEFLFSVMYHSEKLPKDFVDKCAREIVLLMTIDEISVEATETPEEDNA